MKKLISLTLALLMVLALFAACGETNGGETTTQPIADPNAPLSDGNTLKVLAIGNSFSNDTTEYLFNIAKAEGMTDVVIGRLYIGGCSLETHVNNANTNASAYDYYKNTAGTWDLLQSATMLYALQDEQWDIITLQQNSGNSGQAGTYTPYLEQLITYVNENKTNPNARLVWNMTWAYQKGSTKSGFAPYNNDQMTMYNAILDAVESQVVTNEDIFKIIPVGTAIQNARTSYFGDNLTRDTYHLNDLGKVIGAYTWYALFTEKPLEAINLEKIPGVIYLTDDHKAVILEAVNAAIETPFAVTQSVNTLE